MPDNARVRESRSCFHAPARAAAHTGVRRQLGLGADLTEPKEVTDDDAYRSADDCSAKGIAGKECRVLSRGSPT